MTPSSLEGGSNCIIRSQCNHNHCLFYMLYLYKHIFDTLIQHKDKFENKKINIKYLSSHFKAHNQSFLILIKLFKHYLHIV